MKKDTCTDVPVPMCAHPHADVDPIVPASVQDEEQEHPSIRKQAEKMCCKNVILYLWDTHIILVR